MFRIDISVFIMFEISWIVSACSWYKSNGFLGRSWPRHFSFTSFVSILENAHKTCQNLCTCATWFTPSESLKSHWKVTEYPADPLPHPRRSPPGIWTQILQRSQVCNKLIQIVQCQYNVHVCLRHRTVRVSSFLAMQCQGGRNSNWSCVNEPYTDISFTNHNWFFSLLRWMRVPFSHGIHSRTLTLRRIRFFFCFVGSSHFQTCVLSISCLQPPWGRLNTTQQTNRG